MLLEKLIFFQKTKCSCNTTAFKNALYNSEHTLCYFQPFPFQWSVMGMLLIYFCCQTAVVVVEYIYLVMIVLSLKSLFFQSVGLCLLSLQCMSCHSKGFIFNLKPILGQDVLLETLEWWQSKSLLKFTFLLCWDFLWHNWE